MNIDEFVKIIKFDDNGLVPAIAQDYQTNEVLMLAYMNAEALIKTLLTGKIHYFSRSRQSLWLKGETSGHYQFLKGIFYDCDNDTILLKIEQVGVACHTGHRSCFFSELSHENIIEVKDTIPAGANIIDAVYSVILQRKTNPPPKSYVHSLMNAGVDAINKKITEEAIEVIEAGKEKQDNDVILESSDLLFHLLVLLGYRNIPIQKVYEELKKRFGISGIEEKESRKKNSK